LLTMSAEKNDGIMGAGALSKRLRHTSSDSRLTLVRNDTARVLVERGLLLPSLTTMNSHAGSASTPSESHRFSMTRYGVVICAADGKTTEDRRG